MLDLQDTFKNDIQSFQIAFKLRSESINIDFHKFCKYSNLVQKEFLSQNMIMNIFQDCDKIQKEYNIKEENIKKFFELLQDEKGNISIDQYIDLVKLSDLFEVKSLQILLKKFARENFQNIDFIISMILDNRVESDELMIEMEDILMNNITQCLKNEKFSQLEIPILYRIIEKSDHNQIPSDLLYRFIKRSIDNLHPLFYFVDIKYLSDENFNDLCENVSEKYLGNLQSNLKYMKKLKNDLNILENKIKKLEEEKLIEKKIFEKEIIKSQENEFKLKNELQLISNENKQLKETNHQISNENKQLKETNHQISDSDEKLKIEVKKRTEAYNELPNRCLIPIRQEWSQKNINNIELVYNNKWYKVSCSSTCIDNPCHNIKNLFNEVKEKGTYENHLNDCWVSKKYDNNSYIQIEFSQPVIANVLSITSRHVYYEESPSIIRIFGINKGQQQKKLGEFMPNNWQASESRLFKFLNEEPYQFYKIEFNSKAVYVGFAELNLAFDFNK